MNQTPIGTNYIPPMPVVLVGTVVDGKANFMTVGWCSRANHKPPMIAVALGKTHHTPKGILANGTFSVCVPGSAMMKITDYCGVASGKKVDKSGVFETFSGSLEHAPMISDCQINLECELVQRVELPSNYLFIGEIKGAYARADVVENGKAVPDRLDPMILTMPNNRYWTLGEHIGDAWQAGVALAKQNRQ